MASTRPTVLLVNPNRMRPPVAPLALEYLADAARRRGYAPVLCDLAFADDWEAALDGALAGPPPLAVGVTVRNLDDVYFASRDFVLETTAVMVRAIRARTSAPVVLGGVGFSFAPGPALAFCGADLGVVGDGEEALPALLDALIAGADPSGIPGLVHRAGGQIRVNPPRWVDLGALPTPARRFLDNRRYFAEGGQAGVETRRGCTGRCTYCSEPVAHGKASRPRSPESVADELTALLDQGIDAVHLCDAEVNLDPVHLHALCDTLIRRGLGERVRWYAYGAVRPFDHALAQAMARAGCAGVDFGADHGDPAMLRRLGRDYGPTDIAKAVESCNDAGIAVMLDLLLGSPGETEESIARCIDAVREAGPDVAGLSVGVRVYPETPLARWVRRQGPLADNPHLHGATGDESMLRPLFYLAPARTDVHGLVAELVAGDPTFLHADPAEVDGNYNYNDNSALAEAIRAGARGAYWDLLR